MKTSLLFAALLLTSSFAQASILNYSVSLNGANEAPPNSSTGTGTGLITFDDVALTMRVQVTFSGLTGNVTNTHIHAATATAFTGTAGVATMQPTFTGFPAGVTSGTYNQLFDMSLASSFNATYITANGGTATSAFAALLSASQQGKAYLNIHSSFVGSGEIRGFLVPEPSTIALLLSGVAAFSLRRKRS